VGKHRSTWTVVSRAGAAGVAAVAAVGLLAVAEPVGAGIACAPEAATDLDDADSAGSVVAEDGDEVWFLSNASLGGANADGGNEVFHVDVRTDALSMRTDTPPDHALGPPSAAAGAVAFTSSSDLVGDNPDELPQVFVREADGTVRQVTDLEEPVLFEPEVVLRTDGSVLFESAGDFDGSNPDGQLDLWYAEPGDPGTITGLAPSDQVGFDVHASRQGDLATFVSSDDFDGTNADGSVEVWIADLVAGTVESATDSDGGHITPFVSDDGGRVAFVSSGDLDGSNPGGSRQLWSLDLEGTEGPEALTQATDGLWGIFDLHVSDEGNRATLLTDSDLAGENPEQGHLNLWLLDLDTGDRVLLDGDVSQSSGAASIDADGTVASFSSESSLAGENADGNREVWVATCGSSTPRFSDVGVDHPFFAEVQWLAEVGATEGFADGTYQALAPISRQAMAAFLHRLAGAPAAALPTSPTFSDVGRSHAFFEEVEWVAGAGVAEGFADGRFRPLAPVSRQAMAAFVHRMAGAPAVTLPGAPTFVDVGPNHPFATEVEWMAQAGVSAGYLLDPEGDATAYQPLAPVTRQAMAAFLHRLANRPGVHV
jgi:hypothetical protein